MQKALLAASRRPGLRRAVTGNPATRKVVNRFVAGETLDDALAAVRALAADGIAGHPRPPRRGHHRPAPRPTRTRDAYLALLEGLAPLGSGRPPRCR